MLRKINLFKLCAMNRLITSCWAKNGLLIFPLLRRWRSTKPRSPNSPIHPYIFCLLNVWSGISMPPMKKVTSLFTSFIILAVHAFTILRTQNIGLKTFTVLFETPSFFAVTSFVVYCYHGNLPGLFLQYFISLKHTNLTNKEWFTQKKQRMILIKK